MRMVLNGETKKLNIISFSCCVLSSARHAAECRENQDFFSFARAVKPEDLAQTMPSVYGIVIN